MWRVVCLLASVVTVPVASDQLYHDSFGGQNINDGNVDEAPTPTVSCVADSLTRLRRYRDVKTLNRQEVDDVQGAIKELFSGRDVDFAPKRSSNKYSTEWSKTHEVTSSTFLEIINNTDTQKTGSELIPTRSHIARSSFNVGPDWFQQRAALREDTPTITTVSTINSTETEENTTAGRTSTHTMGPTTSPKFDIDALLSIVANLTYDYDTNLTQELNETLQRFSIPTCITPTTTTTTTPSTTSTEMWYTTTVVAKCFVCGMETPGIPRNSYCADAFATDFLPLVPVDARAKGHIARFRKYCRYFDVNNFQNNRSDPRAMLGRWTGGCSVRWIDLSGVYTQRTCRNRLRPTTGRHYGSKRMAKLELTLSNVDDGCIISPMATLVPLSRGVSLYARFHACVCSGNWCNRAEVVQQWTICLWLLFVMVLKL